MGLRIQEHLEGRNSIHLVCKKSSYEMPSMSFGPIGSLPNGVSRTSGTDPRPFAVSGVMVYAPTITEIVPTYSKMKPIHRMTWTTMSAILPDGLHFTLPSSSSSGWWALPSMMYVQIGIRRTIRNWRRMDQVAMYMPSWAQPCGAPLLLVSCRARMRVATKRIASMGQKAMVPFAFSIAFEIKCHSQPVNSFTVTQIQMRMYTVKNCEVRLTTHCIVVEI